MIKIVFFLERLAYKGAIGGAERVLISMVNHMDPSIYDITVFTIYPEIEAEQFSPHVKYRTIFKKRTKINDYLYRFEAEYGLINILHINEKYDFECAYLESGPTKVIAHSRNNRSIKYAWVHCDLSVAFGTSFVKANKKWYKRYDRIICVSEKVKNSFENLFDIRHNTVVLHNVVDSNMIIAKSSLPLPEHIKPGEFTIACVGRLSSEKNPIRLLQVHKRLIDNGFMHTLWLVGDGELREEVRKEICKLNVSSSVQMLGFQSNPYPFMRAADILVSASIYEGFSTFVTEGLILGRPIVTTDCSGMEELLGKNQYGLIVENSEDGLYDGLAEMIQNKELLQYYERKAIERGKRFLTQNMIRDVEKLFKTDFKEVKWAVKKQDGSH